MNISLRRFAKSLIPVALLFLQSAGLWAQAPSEFHWMDLEKDDWAVAVVRKALHSEHFTAIREIGLLGDAAIVFTSNRTRPDAIPDTDAVSVYSVSVRSLAFQKIVTGYRMHVVGWSNMINDHRGELATTYTDCVQCDATTFFTTFYFEGKSDTWQARWMANQHGAPLSPVQANKDYEMQLVYAVLPEASGHEGLVTWARYEYNNSKRVEDFLYRYDVDPISNLDRVQRLMGKEASDTKTQLCQVEPSWAYLHSGQDQPVCQELLHVNSTRARRIVTTPPRQNEGRSQPPR